MAAGIKAELVIRDAFGQREPRGIAVALRFRRRTRSYPMQASMFNVRVPLPSRREVFLMNTFTDAQLVVSDEVAALLDSLDDEPGAERRPRLDAR